MARQELFELVAGEIERLTDLDRLEARGTLRLALRNALFDPELITPSEMKAAVDKVLVRELNARGVPGAEEVCSSIVATLEDTIFASASPDSADEIFDRLVRRSGAKADS